MLITKILTTSVDLLDPNDMYNADLDNVILRKLKDRYIKKCYQSMYILDITRLIRRSLARITDVRLDAGASVDVQFEVSGVILNQGEVLHGCVVLEIRDDIITAEHEYAGIKLQKDPTGQIIRILQVGQKIPVVVHNVRYTVNESKISVLGSPYAPYVPDAFTYFNITESVNPDESEMLDVMLSKIQAEEDLHKQLQTDAKQYEFFKDKLYPYKIRQKAELHKSLEAFKPVSLELKSMLEIDNGIVVYPHIDERINKRFFISDTLPPNAVVINISAYGVFMDILTKYYLYLQALRGFIETYPTPKEAQELMSYWSMCKKLQQ